MKYLIYLLILCGCTHHKNLMSLRTPASETTEIKVRFFNHTEYLPRKISLFKRMGSFTGTLFLDPLTQGELSCTEFHQYGKTWEKSLIIAEKKSLEIPVSLNELICEYKGSERIFDLNLKFILNDRLPDETNYQVVNLNKIKNKINLNLDLIKSLDENTFDANFFEALKNKNLILLKTALLDQNNPIYENKLLPGSWFEINNIRGGLSKSTGPITQSIPFSGIEMSLGLSSLEFSQYKKYAVVCELIEASGSKSIILHGELGLGKQYSKKEGKIRCVINNKVGGSLSISGKVEFEIKKFSRENTKKKLNEELATLQTEVADLEQKIKAEIDELKSYDQKHYTQYWANLTKINNENLKNEPPKYCEEKNAHKTFTFLETKRMGTDKTGEFCGLPILVGEKLVAACDGPNDKINYFHGRLYVFDKSLKKLQAITIKALPSEYSDAVSLSSRSSLIKLNQSPYAFVVSTFDGRLLFYDKNIVLKKTVTLSQPAVFDLKLFSDETIFFLSSASGMFTTDVNFNLISSTGEILFSEANKIYPDINSYKIYNDLIYAPTAKGSIYIFSKQGQKISEIEIEKNSSLGEISFKDDYLYLGSSSGKLYKASLTSQAVFQLAQIPMSGKMRHDVGQDARAETNQIYDAPVIFKNGNIAILTSDDNRVHFLNSNGEYKFATNISSVRTNFIFDKFIFPDDSEGVIVNSITYMNVLDENGNLVAIGQTVGAENMTTYLKLSPSEYLFGMYKGVFQYSLRPSVNGETIMNNICE